MRVLSVPSSVPFLRTVVAALPAFVTVVGLFVDPQPDAVRSTLAQVPLDLLQFHGDEPPELCASFGRPYIKAVPVKPGPFGVGAFGTNPNGTITVGYPGFAAIAAILPLPRRADRSRSVSDIDWDEEVQVLEPSTFGKGDVIEGGRLIWEHVSLSEAVERCLGLPPADLAKVNILAANACYSAPEIETLYQRRDFPHSVGLN